MVVVANRMSSTITTLPGTRTPSSSSFLVRTWTLWLRSIFAAKEPPAFHGEHQLAVLVHRLPAVLHQPDAFARGGRPRFNHGAAVGEGVARTHRLEPADAVDARRAEAGGLAQVAFHHQAHADRAGMPAARNQAAEHRFAGGRRVGMEWLRIELAAEGQDLLFRKAVAAHLGAVPDTEVFPPNHRSRRGGQLLAQCSRGGELTCCVPLSPPRPRCCSPQRPTRKASGSASSAPWPSCRASTTGPAPRWRATRSTRRAASTWAASAGRSS